MDTLCSTNQLYPIPVFAINLPSRVDRKRHLLSQFKDKNEFDLQIVTGESKFKTGSFNLWLTIQTIVKTAQAADYDYFILCEDDHTFTTAYSFNHLEACIQRIQKFNPDLLSGGLSGFQTGLKIDQNLYWIEKFAGLQFTIIFKKFYRTLLNAPFSHMNDVADYKLATLTSHKYVIYPFISIQKEFGYSDVTQTNSIKGTVETLFANCERFFSALDQIHSFYHENKGTIPTRRKYKLWVWGNKKNFDLLKGQADIRMVHTLPGKNKR